MKVLAIAVLVAPMIASCDADQPAAGGDTQIAQFQALADRTAADIDDSLFILWEYGGALRERALAQVVADRAKSDDVRSLANLVRDGHQAGMDAMAAPARELEITLPTEPTISEQAAIAALRGLPVERLEAFFIRRQRSMHAWDIVTFDDYRPVASNARLRTYVEAVRNPLRDHSAIVDRVAKAHGVIGSL